MVFSKLLKQEFQARQSKNPRYSLRAFASQLGIDQSLLSKILREERTASQSTVLKVLRLLSVPPEAAKKYLSPSMALKNKKNLKYKKLGENHFEKAFRWQSFAVLELLQLKSLKWTMENVASALELKKEETLDILTTLFHVGLVSETGGVYRCSSNHNTWTNLRSTSESRRQMQKDFLQKALHAVDHVDFSQRENSSATVTFSLRNLPKAKKMIEKFSRAIVDLAEADLQNEEVFQLAVAFYPLTSLNESTAKLSTSREKKND